MTIIGVALIASSLTTIPLSSVAAYLTTSLDFSFIEAVIDFNRFLDQLTVGVKNIIDYLILNSVL